MRARRGARTARQATSPTTRSVKSHPPVTHAERICDSSFCPAAMQPARTWNLRLRRPTPYPLGQWTSWSGQLSIWLSIITIIITIIISSSIVYICICIYIYIYIYTHVNNMSLEGTCVSGNTLAEVAREAGRNVCPISLLRLSLLRLLGSTFPGDSLWTWEFHPLESRFCSSQTLWNPESYDGDWPYTTTLWRTTPANRCIVVSRILLRRLGDMGYGLWLGAGSQEPPSGLSPNSSNSSNSNNCNSSNSSNNNNNNANKHNTNNKQLIHK